MKVCSKCNQEKPLSEFNKHSNRRDGLSSWCKTCVREGSKKHYGVNRDRILKTKEVYHLKASEWYRELKASLKCSKCEEDHPATLEFHHLDPSKKDFAISKMRNAYKSKEKALEEIKKCIVLCSNCHKKLHWEEKNN